MTTIVVPLDGSEFAETAIRPAVGLATRMAGGSVLLVTCSRRDPAEAERYLRERAAHFASVVATDVRLVDSNGDVAGEILETVSSTPDSLLCMASHGHGGLRTAVLGSVAEQVMCRTVDPVVLIGPQCRTVLLAEESGDLVVCFDGSTFSEAVIPAARQIAEALKLAPWMVEVVGPDEMVTPADEASRNREVQAATERLHGLVPQIQAQDAPTNIRVLHGANVGRAIADFANRLPAAAVAVATHGRTGLLRAALGSVATDILRLSPCPVLVVRAQSDSKAR